MLPSLSDVSTTDEWREVAEGLLGKAAGESQRIVVVDWPGLGLSERPPINYTADALEGFLADFMSATDGPLGSSSGYSHSFFVDAHCVLYVELRMDERKHNSATSKGVG